MRKFAKVAKLSNNKADEDVEDSNSLNNDVDEDTNHNLGHEDEDSDDSDGDGDSEDHGNDDGEIKAQDTNFVDNVSL